MINIKNKAYHSHRDLKTISEEDFPNKHMIMIEYYLSSNKKISVSKSHIGYQILDDMFEYFEDTNGNTFILKYYYSIKIYKKLKTRLFKLIPKYFLTNTRISADIIYYHPMKIMNKREPDIKHKVRW